MKVLLTFLLPALIVILKPLEMTFSQSIVLATLFLTVTWWATGYVNKEISSVFMIIMFIIFGRTPIKDVFFFPLSSDFITIIAAFILSQGIVNAKIADRFSRYVLNRFCKNSKRLVLMSFILGVLFIFIIPQPFPRVIILASIYTSFLKNQNVSEDENQVLIFSIFMASTVTCMMFLNGDVILNYVAIKFAGITMSQAEWIKYMLVPSATAAVILYFAYIFAFRKKLKTTFTLISEKREKMGRKEVIALLIMMFVVIFWMTESTHGIKAMYISSGGVILMFLFGIIGFKDISTININLLIFLTAAFSIGKVLTGSGVSFILSDYFLTFFPQPNNIIYLPFILLLIVIVHMLFGSTITALSVITPSLIGITEGILSPEFIALLAYSSVSIQYLLPFQHVTILIGFGSGYYKNSHVLKIGILLSAILPLIIFGIFVPWWKLMGL